MPTETEPAPIDTTPTAFTVTVQGVTRVTLVDGTVHEEDVGHPRAEDFEEPMFMLGNASTLRACQAAGWTAYVYGHARVTITYANGRPTKTFTMSVNHK